MRHIHRYCLGLRGRFVISCREGAEVICASDQDGNVCVWVEEDSFGQMNNKEFLVLFTGDAVDSNNTQYVGTAFIEGLVCHVYEVLT